MRTASSRRWPLTVLLPLGVSITMFAVAVGTTQVGLAFLESREVRALEAKATIFLNALAGVVAPRLGEGEGAVADLLDDPLAFRETLAEESLVARWRGPDGVVLSVTRGDPEGADMAQALEAIAQAPASTVVFARAEPGTRAIIARAYEVEGRRLELVAALDASDLVAELSRNEAWALVIDLVLATIAALLTFVITRRAVAPLDALARELVTQDKAGSGRARPASAEISRLRDAIATRLEAEEARTQALADLGEKERNALLAKLAAGLAHEVRNPLAGLLNAVSTLRRFGEKPEVRADTLDLIERGLRSIERVADAMLSTYRPAPGRMRFSREDLMDIQLLVAPEARRRHVALEWAVEAMRPIAADSDALRQILLNLLLNACKASPERGRVGLRVEQDAGETRFVVSDSGQGMPEDVLAFVTEGRGTTPLTKGKGLGLWMVSRLIDDLGGQVRVESRSGEGTTVVVRLPTGPAPEDAAAGAEAAS
ncbi:sensor histidine kinase [Salinarimonas chemoclinalis]|uniref:sensor histidine kinase n=1 Tax=Salinarimonas chemoclinalis TaxID=3241599 RepID=UPI003556187D